MVIVLRDFEGFCGFRPLSEIKGFIESIKELKEAIGEFGDFRVTDDAT